MTSRILIPSDVCDDEEVLYLARRYGCNPMDVISCSLQQESFIKYPCKGEHIQALLEENEMEILRDRDICPSEIEFI